VVQAYLIVASLGALVGGAELISRYRDRPGSLVRVPSTWFYVLINAGAGIAALLLIHAFAWSFGAHDPDSVRATQILVAGLGSMALFRSSVFTVRVHDEDVSVGPSALLSALLAAADRGVDRVRAQHRSSEARKMMSAVSFAKSRLALPTLCLALLQNVSAEDQRDLRTAVDALAASDMTDAQKSLNLGLLLMNIAGPEVVKAAVETLGTEILRDEQQAELSVLPTQEGGSSARRGILRRIHPS
jgi:mRNA-degrading endonuclease toxin of MazEF toxin-antitoxin module